MSGKLREEYFKARTPPGVSQSSRGKKCKVCVRFTNKVVTKVRAMIDADMSPE